VERILLVSPFRQGFFQRGDNPSGHNVKFDVKEAYIVLPVKGEAEEDSYKEGQKRVGF
jgi:hypothetical protein